MSIHRVVFEISICIKCTKARLKIVRTVSFEEHSHYKICDIKYVRNPREFNLFLHTHQLRWNQRTLVKSNGLSRVLMLWKSSLENKIRKLWLVKLKGTHIFYLSSSLYIINQKPVIPRTYFHCITTWVANSSG